MDQTDLFDPLPYIAVMEESEQHQVLALVVEVDIDGPGNRMQWHLHVTTPASGDLVFARHGQSQVSPRLVAALAATISDALERALRQLSPF